jgi:hypothetical protein
MQFDHLEGTIGQKDESGREHPECRSTERIEIRTTVDELAAAHAFRRQESRSTENGGRVRDHGGSISRRFLHQAEIEHLEKVELTAVAADHEIGRLHVAVNQALRVRLG